MASQGDPVSIGATSGSLESFASISLMESDESTEWSVLVSAFQNKLKATFSVISDIEMNRDIKGKLLLNRESVYLVTQGYIEDLLYNPFGKTAKTAVVYEVHSESEVNMQMYMDKSELLLPDLPPGKFIVSTRDSRNKFKKQPLNRTDWSLVYRLSGPFLGSEGFDPDMKPETVCGNLLMEFKRLFASCIEKKVDVVQLPLLSCALGMSKTKQDVLDMMVVMVVSDALASLQKLSIIQRPFCVNIVTSRPIPIYEAMKKM